MTKEELIAELQKCPDGMEVCVWSEEDDENVPVVQAIWESGTSHIQLLTVKEDVIDAPPSSGGA